MWMEFEDKETFTLDKQFMLGGALLSAPILKENCKKHSSYLPVNYEWYDFFTLQLVTETGWITHENSSLESIPLFIKGGNVMPLKLRRRRSTKAMQKDPFTIYVALCRSHVRQS